MLKEDGAQELEGNYVELFLLVITVDAQDVVDGLIDVFEGKEVGESDVVD